WADILTEDGECGATIHDHQDVVARLVDPMNRPDRHAALGQSGCDSNAGSQHQPRNSLTPAGVFARGHSDKRTGTAMRYEAADEVGPTRRGRIRCRLLQIATAWISMDECQHRLSALYPFRVLARQIRPGIRRCGEDPEVFRGQRRGHYHRRGLVENLV